MINVNPSYPINVLLLEENDDYPFAVTINSTSDICALLGYDLLKYTPISDMCVISSANVSDDDLISIDSSFTEDGITHKISICGDVVITGYDLECEEVTSLTQEQIDAIMFDAEYVI